MTRIKLTKSHAAYLGATIPDSSYRRPQTVFDSEATYGVYIRDWFPEVRIYE